MLVSVNFQYKCKCYLCLESSQYGLRVCLPFCAKPKSIFCIDRYIAKFYEFPSSRVIALGDRWASFEIDMRAVLMCLYEV